MVNSVASGGKVGSSDHDIISFEMRCFSKFQGRDKTVLDFSKANFTLAKELLSIDWASLLSHLDPGEAWSVFQCVVSDTTKQCIPLKKAVVRNRPIWISREVLKLGQPGKNVNCGDATGPVKILTTLLSTRIRSS